MTDQSRPVRAYTRRTGRISRHYSVVLRWREADGKTVETAAETRVLSQYGCLVTCPVRFKLGDELVLFWPEKQRSTQAKVVFRMLSAPTPLVELAFEFLGTENFWGIDFPADLQSGKR